MMSLETEKMQFAANLTHDLLNPIAAIKLTAEVVKKHIGDGEDQRMLQNIVNTSTKIADMISHILKMSKAISQEVLISTFSIKELINEVLETVSISAEAKNLLLYADLTDDIDVTADRTRCLRILLNLVENAIKYTEKGYVRIRGFQKNDQIYLEVADTGIGIPKEKRADIFNCYTQLESGNISTEGVGLGLHLTLLFAEQMGGKIRIKSQKNKGSIFSFSFSSCLHSQEAAK